jgi:hypothetical protein
MSITTFTVKWTHRSDPSDEELRQLQAQINAVAEDLLTGHRAWGDGSVDHDTVVETTFEVVQ